MNDKSPYKLKEIKFEVTHKCPLACIHCSSEAAWDVKREMSFEILKNIVKQLKEYNINEISLSGGEPLLWDDIAKLVEECSNKTKKISLYTSGNVSGFSNLIGNLETKGLTKVITSIYAADQGLHERITRIRGSFFKTINAIEKIKKTKLELELHFVIFNVNYQELLRVVKLSNELGVKKISLLRFVPQGRGAVLKDFVLSKTENLELKKMIDEGRKNIEIRTGSPYNFLLVNEKPKCLAGIDRMSVSPEYDIYPCDAFKQIKAKDIVGTNRFSLLDKWPLKDCWEKSPYLNKVREILKKQFCDECLCCTLLPECNSGCLAQKVIANNKFIIDRDPLCLRI